MCSTFTFQIRSSIQMRTTSEDSTIGTRDTGPPLPCTALHAADFRTWDTAHAPRTANHLRMARQRLDIVRRPLCMPSPLASLFPHLPAPSGCAEPILPQRACPRIERSGDQHVCWLQCHTHASTSNYKFALTFAASCQACHASSTDTSRYCPGQANRSGSSGYRLTHRSNGGEEIHFSNSSRTTFPSDYRTNIALLLHPMINALPETFGFKLTAFFDTF